MSHTKLCLIFIAVTCLIQELTAQRGFYSGFRPQGYKDQFVPQTQQTLEDRFQANVPLTGTEITSQRPALPVNAHGDQGLIDRLNQLPRDKQPFWFINYQQLEAQRGQAFPAQTAGQTQNNIQGGVPAVANNAVDNRFTPQTAPLFNSPYQIVQGVAPTGNFVFP